jgi:hypothetical protein
MSHQERIPWISHHPLNVKRGTFIGKMSRLSTLSSTHSTYCHAVKSLATLYITHGYPSKLVYNWIKNNIQERWIKCFNDNKVQCDHVLVLKSEFNTTWDYFNASELGNTILGFWRDWLQHAKDNDFNMHYPQYTTDAAEDLTILVARPDGVSSIPGICKLDILNRRMIVSHKHTCTHNLFDLTNLWKKIVLTNMEQQVLQNNHNLPNPNIGNEFDMDIQDDDFSSTDEGEDPFIQLLWNSGAFF